MTTRISRTKNPASAALKAAMTSLATMPIDRLRAEYEKALGTPAGKTKRDSLIKALAVRATAGTAAAATTEAPATARQAPRATKARDPRLPKVGTVLTREFKGKTYEVKVLADGFEFQGRDYRSLTKIALEITEYPSVSGPLFWGIAPRPGAKPKQEATPPAEAAPATPKPAAKKKSGRPISAKRRG